MPRPWHPEHFFNGLLMTLPVLLLGLGLALIVAEVLFPSFGVLAILATLSIVAAILVAFREGVGGSFLLATAVLVPLVIMLGFRLFPRSPMGKHMVASGLSFEGQRSSDRRDLGLVGVEGLVEATLRPAGIARLDGRRVDVVTRGERIDAGERIVVVDVEGNRVIVARTEREGAPTVRQERT